MISLDKFQFNIWFLGLFFYPLAFFMIKLNAFDISFFKVIVVILTTIHLYSLIIKKKIFLNKFLLIFILIFSISCLLNGFSQRLLLNSISYLFILVYSIIGISVLKKNKSELVLGAFKKVITMWFMLLFLGFLQLIFSYYGIDLSWESIGEPSPENKGNFLGKLLLRPSSVFGEPRRFSAHILLIYFLYISFCKKVKVNYIFIFIFLGLSTQSSTFFLVLVFSILAFYGFSLLKISMFGILTFISFEFILATLQLAIPRLMILEEFSISLLNTPAFAEQAGDLSFFLYVLYSDLSQFIFGNGMGMSNDIIALFTDKFIYTKSAFEFINSRWLFYTLLIDFGLIGIIYFIYIIKKYLPINKSFKTVSLLSIIASLFTGSFIFVFILIVLHFLNEDKYYRFN